ncbi:hypothetical protein A3K86_15225 [Photobacterium jeanii]|uniref:Invasion protein n=1 Tax=Photobacterium jeanii TaxID=858640 RepID=A0A178K7A6_9GAMM|nr:SirB2 family protein [Photobacterium jeanii]OAN13017.1 hypothetical protein A3K86_15225 [Photobacterium jeanii]PST89166.1 hypothetical protein C9I91_13670 [Photobacterium jeanii]
MYFIIKNIHLTSVTLSILLYVYRFAMYYSTTEVKTSPKWLKVIPHINDTLLLSTGLALIGITGFIPFTDAAPWLTIKLGAVFGYIFCGFYALSKKQTVWVRWGFFTASLAWLVTVICLAVFKNIDLLFG